MPIGVPTPFLLLHREMVSKGLRELQQGITCLDNFQARGRPRLEEQNPQRAAVRNTAACTASTA